MKPALTTRPDRSQEDEFRLIMQTELSDDEETLNRIEPGNKRTYRLSTYQSEAIFDPIF